MSGRHCPFLNRDDDRCADHFRVGSLRQAFAHCVSEYTSCPTYALMLQERRARIAAEIDRPAVVRPMRPAVQVTVRGSAVAAGVELQLAHDAPQAA